MDNRTLLRTGVAGTVVAALCCATPVLVILLGAVGLSAWVGRLDYTLIPALVLFLGITIYALRRRRAEFGRLQRRRHRRAATADDGDA